MGEPMGGSRSGMLAGFVPPGLFMPQKASYLVASLQNRRELAGQAHVVMGRAPSAMSQAMSLLNPMNESYDRDREIHCRAS